MAAPAAQRRLSDPIRVVRVITRLNVGGPAHQATLLSERLDPVRFRTTLVSGEVGAGEADLTELLRTVGPDVVVRTLRREIQPLDDLKTLIALVRLLRKTRPDVLHTHLAKAGLLGRIAGRLTGVPVIVHTFHGNVLQGYFGRLTSWTFLVLERMLARMSTAVVAISHGQVAELERLGIARGAKVVRVPLGLDLQPFLEAETGRLRAELAVPEDVPLIGIVARLVPIKAVDLFLEAAAIVRSERPDSRFVVIGDGELRPELEALVRARGLNGAVRFLGWRADLPSIYADLDVLVLTSRNEGTPVSVIEALAAGRAVVATRVGGVPDLLESPDCGITVPPGDGEAIARAVLKLIDDPVRRASLGAAGRARVYPEHDISTLVLRIEELYERLVASGRHVGRTKM